MLCLFEKRPRKTKQRIEDSWCLQVALGPGEGHQHTWGQEMSFSLHCLCLCLTSSRPGGPAPLMPRLFFPEPAFLQGFALDPQAVCVLSIHSLLREDEFGEAFLLFPGARFLHSRGVLGAWSWWHSQVAELVGSAFGKERAIPQHLWGSGAEAGGCFTQEQSAQVCAVLHCTSHSGGCKSLEFRVCASSGELQVFPKTGCSHC